MVTSLTEVRRVSTPTSAPPTPKCAATEHVPTEKGVSSALVPKDSLQDPLAPVRT